MGQAISASCTGPEGYSAKLSVDDEMNRHPDDILRDNKTKEERAEVASSD